MKRLFTYCSIAVLACVGQALSAQETLRDRIARRNAQQENSAVPQLTVRAANKNKEMTQDISKARWMREVYRLVDLDKERNAPLYFPIEPDGDRMNFFTMIFRLFSEGKIDVYEYLLDGRESFSEKHKIAFGEDFLKRYNILYKHENNRFVIHDSDIPSAEVTSYYIKEAWYFDASNSVVDVKTLAICPILYRQDDFGSVATPYPLFWLPYESVRPFAARLPIMTSALNNATTGTVDDFFRRRLFEGDIYKITNFKNQTLVQMFPNQDARKKEQARIETQLTDFQKGLWATCAECDSLAANLKVNDKAAEKVAKASANEKKRTNESLDDKKAASSSANKTAAQPAKTVKRSMRNRR